VIWFILVKYASTTDIHHKLMEVYGNGIMEYSMLENGKMNLKMVQQTYMMVNKHSGPAQQRWMWTQHEWRKQLLENWWVTTWDLPTVLELATETVHKSVHEELGHHNLRVHAGYKDAWWKSTEINTLQVVLHIFNSFKNEISSWNPQW